MGISLEQYRGAIGSYNCVKYTSVPSNSIHYYFATLIGVSNLLIAIIILLLRLSNDIELNPGPDRKNIRVCQINIRGLRANFSDLQTSVSNLYDIICIQETMLSNNVNDDNLKIPGYQKTLRRDRDQNGGGLIIYLSNNIRAKRRPDLESSNNETMWVEMKLKGLAVLLCNCYRPPSAGVEFWDSFQCQLDKAKRGSIRNILISGDLNADAKTAVGRYFASFIQQNHLSAHVDQPTRITAVSSTCFDQIISNIPYLLKNVTIISPIGTSDHCVVAAQFGFNIEKRKCYQRKVWYYKKADFDYFRSELAGHNWDSCFSSGNPDTICTEWTKTFLEIANKCIPNKIITIRPDDVPWYNSHLRRLRNLRDRSYSTAKKKNNARFWEIYRQHRNKYINELHNAEEAYYSSMADKLSSSDTPPKTWWKTVKYFLGKNKESDLPPIEDGTSIHYSNDEKAEAFNNFFLNNAFLNSNNATLPKSVPSRTERITNIVATEQDVLDIIKSVNVNKAAGPDGVSPTMLREAGLSIVKPLTKLINLSLRTAIFPDSWKLAHVLPLHKKNDKSEINNYRPISLLSCVSKIAERVVFKYTFNYIRENHLLSPFQSGFIPGDSTVNQLVNVYHMLCEALDKKKEVRVVFCDISKAFDRVWHEGLLYKPERMGISGALLLWFKSYISNRKQKVIIENSSSKTGDIQAGVPQGSVLGPLLFLIYINDITENVNSHIRLFADDTTLFIDFSDEITATQQINNDLATIRDWADRWLVSFCPKKTEALLVSLKHRTNPPPPIYFGQTRVTEVESHKHLGIILNNNLSWNEHID